MARLKEETQDLFIEGAMAAAKRETMAKAHTPDGADCPCCGQLVKVYRRTITSTMARQLITVYHMHGAGTWFHTRDAVLIDSSGAGDFAKLEIWQLIEKMPHSPGDDGKKSSGYWRVTGKGRRFILGEIECPEWAAIYNGDVMGFAEECAGIRAALGNKFDYNDLMKAQVAA